MNGDEGRYDVFDLTDTGFYRLPRACRSGDYYVLSAALTENGWQNGREFRPVHQAIRQSPNRQIG